MTPVPFFRALLSFTPRLSEPQLLRPPSSAVHLPCLSFPHDRFSPLSMEALWGHALLMWTIGCLQPAGELLKICLKQNYYVFEHSVVEEKKIMSALPFRLRWKSLPMQRWACPSPVVTEGDSLRGGFKPHFTSQWAMSTVWAGPRKHSENGRWRGHWGKPGSSHQSLAFLLRNTEGS